MKTPRFIPIRHPKNAPNTELKSYYSEAQDRANLKNASSSSEQIHALEGVSQ